MKEFISKVKRIPWWGILAGFGFFALQRGMYRLGDFVSRVTGTIDHAFACKIAAIDDLIPVVRFSSSFMFTLSYSGSVDQWQFHLPRRETS